MILGVLEAHGKTFSIECTVFGLLEQSKKYEPIVKGNLVVNEQTLNELESTSVAINRKKQIVKRYCNHITDQQQQKECADRLFIPIGIRSQLFGKPEGIQLEISTWKGVGNDWPPYSNQRIIINGLPVIQASIENNVGRLTFNNDTTASVDFSSTGELLPSYEKSPVIVIPEGQFRFINSDCRKTVTP